MTLVFTDLDLENYSHLRRVYFTRPKANIVTLLASWYAVRDRYFRTEYEKKKEEEY